MAMQKRIERKTASLLLYGLQIASSNLKRIDQEKPQPDEIVTDPEDLSPTTEETAQHNQSASEVDVSPAMSPDAKKDVRRGSKNEENDGTEPPRPGKVTIRASYQPGPQGRDRQSHQRRKQYVI
jgi:hypothetical protein